MKNVNIYKDNTDYFNTQYEAIKLVSDNGKYKLSIVELFELQKKVYDFSLDPSEIVCWNYWE